MAPGLLSNPHAAGLLSWTLPFVISFAFFKHDAATGKVELAVSRELFKSAMVVCGSLCGTWLLSRVLHPGEATLRSGLALGAYWMALNWALDYTLLLPLSGQSVGEYAADIGLRYLVAPISGACLGAMAQAARGAAAAGAAADKRQQ